MKLIQIRDIQEEDAPIISAGFASQGWDKPISQYLRCWQESLNGTRQVLLAESAGEFAGYLTIVWESNYPPFREVGIPEIVDLNVLEKFQRRGIGTALMDEAERLIAKRSRYAGIGEGLTPDYGKAQILYVKRGYVPDGKGVYQGDGWLSQGDQVNIGHDIALYLTKELRMS